jgi:ATP-binding cassette subfamily B protein
MLYQAFQQGLQLSRSLLDDVGQLYANTLFLGNLFDFLALEPKVVSRVAARPLPVVRQAIRFRGVSFRYPGAARPAVRDLDLEIPAGRITAVVGANGAGKSTLIKLLCRFYDPEEGGIEIDHADLRTVDLDSLRASITVLFQQPVHYNATVAGNIALGDIASAPDRAAIRTAAEAAGAEEIIRGLPSGYDHLLGRWFENGTELSAGEWQRIALARAFLRQAPILVLDEPTSAMDPWAESDWLGRFRQLAAGRTTMVITHRFSTARIADMIHVMSDGQVIERGSHDELISAGGRYAEGWSAQAHP